MEKKEAQNLLNAAISEIRYALNSHKSQDVKEFYLKNAIRYINDVKENLEEVKKDGQ